MREKRIPIDILPDREAATLETWLKAHAGVEIISRDRGGPYAEGARAGAPDAQQVADRFQLLVNLSEALKPFFNRKQTQLKALVEKPPETFSEEEAKQLEAWYVGHSTYTKKQRERSDTYQQARVERYHKVNALRAKGAEITLIAHQTGLSRQTVHTYLKLKHPPGRKTGKRSGSVIDPYKEYLVKRWNDGVPPKRPPTASQVAHWITCKEEQLALVATEAPDPPMRNRSGDPSSQSPDPGIHGHAARAQGGKL